MIRPANWSCALVVALFACLLFACPIRAQGSPPTSAAQPPSSPQASATPTGEQLAKDVRNPFADLIQVQISNEFDFGGAAGNGTQYTLTLQPIIPIRINNHWNLITRSAFTVANVPDSSGSGRTTGTGDSYIEFYFSPDKAKPIIWGIGPVVGFPTASDSALGSGKWTAGPGFAVIRQTEHWTYGVLANQVWSYAGDRTREGVSLALIHPSLSYTWASGWTVALDSESYYNAKGLAGERWTVPVQICLGKITKFAGRDVNLSFGVLPYAVAPSGSPSVGLNFTATPLFPRR